MEFDPAEGEPSYEAVLARFHPDDRAERNRLFARALETGETYQCDLRLILPSGTPRCCHLIGRPILDAAGRVVRMAATFQDITESVEREQQVRDANLVLETQKVQLEVANMELAALATTDPLTGLLNYRAFQARFAEVTAGAGHKPVAVALLDLDDFRFFNDCLWRSRRGRDIAAGGGTAARGLRRGGCRGPLRRRRVHGPAAGRGPRHDARQRWRHGYGPSGRLRPTSRR